MKKLAYLLVFLNCLIASLVWAQNKNTRNESIDAQVANLLAKMTLEEREQLNVRVTVKNTGNRTGKEIVQLYLTDLVASVTPCNKMLKRFTKIELAPGESKSVSFTLHQDDLSFIGRDNKPVVEPGEFNVAVRQFAQKFEQE